MYIYYEGTKNCKKCGRDLPNNSLYYPVDKGCKSGLRNVCRECNPKYKRFLEKDHRINEKWDDEEINLLKSIYKKMSNDDIVNKYFQNRTIKAIETIASKYGFNHKDESVLEEKRKEVAKTLPQCQKGAIRSETCRNHISVAQKKRYSNKTEREKVRIKAIEQGRWRGDSHPIHKNPLFGERNGRWKGGTSDLSVQLRRDIVDWKKSSSEFCNYKCILTGLRFQNIHHVISFNSMLQNALSDTGLNKKDKVADYTYEEYQSLRDKIVQYHSSTLYGACLCKELHELFHKEYTYYDSSINDFILFIDNMVNGKYNNFLVDNNICLNVNEKYINYLKSNHRNMVA